MKYGSGDLRRPPELDLRRPPEISGIYIYFLKVICICFTCFPHFFSVYVSIRPPKVWESLLYFVRGFQIGVNFFSATSESKVMKFFKTFPF